MKIYLQVALHTAAMACIISLCGVEGLAFAVVLPALVEARGKYQAREKTLSEWTAKYSKNGQLDADLIKADGMTTVAFGEEFRKHEAELGDLYKDVQHWKSIEDSQKEIEVRRKEMSTPGETSLHPDPEQSRKAQPNSDIGRMIIQSDAYKQRGRAGSSGPTTTIPAGLSDLKANQKARFWRSNGWDPEERRSGYITLDEQRPIQVVDLIPSIPTTLDLYKYMQETTYSNQAAEVAENSQTTWGEASLVLTERSQAVEKIAVYVPVSDEQLDDVEGAEAYVNQRLSFMVMQQLDSQIINGSGTSPNLQGVLNATGLNTQAQGSLNAFDAAHKAATTVRTTGRGVPGAYILHSNDWQGYRLLRTTDGVYVLGNPGVGAPQQLWGLPVILSESLTEGTGLVGDFANYSLLVEKSGMDVQIGYIADYFVRGLKAVRASIRVGVVWTRGTAFTQITGISF